MRQRLMRINELLKREISLVFQKDFVFANALVTVNAVEISPDLRNA
ncbi:MAG: ribosome-binding factor A, partial [Verrucomicrobiales bacterium]